MHREYRHNLRSCVPTVLVFEYVPTCSYGTVPAAVGRFGTPIAASTRSGALYQDPLLPTMLPGGVHVHSVLAASYMYLGR